LKKIFKKNHIIITVLALMIAVAGYINYSDAIRSKNKTGIKTDVPQESETDAVNGDILSNDVETGENNPDNPGETIFTSGSNSAFIVSAKLEREQVRAANKETLLEIINNANLTEAEKAEASSKMMAMTDASQKEAAAELMLEARGFNNVIVSIIGNQADVVIEKEELNDTELAQVEDIVKRKTDIPIGNITITAVKPTAK
jgi:stage III sporulation protein AH